MKAKSEKHTKGWESGHPITYGQSKKKKEKNNNDSSVKA